MKLAGLYLTILALTLIRPSAAPGREGEIVFSSNRSGSWRLWSIHADGTALTQITKQTTDDQDVDPMFSPDGKSMLFTSTRGGKVGLWRLVVGGGGDPERVCDGDQGEWAPDGKKIALRRNERIMVRTLASGEEKTISPDDWPHCSGPAWSPEGKSIAFAARWESGNGVFVASEGGKPVKVYDQQGACEPHWSPDGKRLVYETETHICTINPDGTKNRTITYFGGVQRYARYSPDGKLLVFCQAPSEQGPWELYIVPATGGAPAKLTEGGSDMYPDWK